MASNQNSTSATEWEKSSSAFNSKQSSEFLDPCADFSERSRKWLHRNGGHKDFCTEYFNAYKECKKQWMAERAEEKRRKRQGWFSSSS